MHIITFLRGRLLIHLSALWIDYLYSFIDNKGNFNNGSILVVTRNTHGIHLISEEISMLSIDLYIVRTHLTQIYPFDLLIVRNQRRKKHLIPGTKREKMI